MAGLEDLGIPGPAQVREVLTNCTDDTFAAIEEFQVTNLVMFN